MYMYACARTCPSFDNIRWSVNLQLCTFLIYFLGCMNISDDSDSSEFTGLTTSYPPCRDRSQTPTRCHGKCTYERHVVQWWCLTHDIWWQLQHSSISFGVWPPFSSFEMTVIVMNSDEEDNIPITQLWVNISMWQMIEFTCCQKHTKYSTVH